MMAIRLLRFDASSDHSRVGCVIAGLGMGVMVGCDWCGSDDGTRSFFIQFV